jgi:hypothetical protein
VAELLVKSRTAEPERGCERPDGPAGSREAEEESGKRQADCSLLEHDLGPRSLPEVCFVFQVRSRRPQRESDNFVASRFHAFDLAPDERMADRRIEIAKIGEAHAHSATADPLDGHSKGSSIERELNRDFERRRGGKLDVAAGKSLGDQVRLVARMKFVAEIFDVPLDRSRRNAQLQGALLRGKPASDALKHLPLSFGQGDEIFLLPRKIHH